MVAEGVVGHPWGQFFFLFCPEKKIWVKEILCLFYSIPKE
jgi:hypothetical protein